MENLKEEDRIIWTRIFGKVKEIKSSPGEFVRYVKSGKKVVIILDDRLLPINVPIGEVSRGEE